MGSSVAARRKWTDHRSVRETVREMHYYGESTCELTLGVNRGRGPRHSITGRTRGDTWILIGNMLLLQ